MPVSGILVARGSPALAGRKEKGNGMRSFEVRHGDVGLIRVDALPAGAMELPVADDIVLAIGEATGHAHRITSRTVRVFRVGDTRYLVVEHPADLVQTDRTGRIGQRGGGHDLHGVTTVERGVFEVVIERDYVRGAVPRQVLD